MVEERARPTRPHRLAPDEEAIKMPIHTDPVCHMQVDQHTAVAQSEFQGRRYYFCSPGCKEKFDRDPGSYAGAAR
jgi:YHS domain-containing protein